MNRTVPRRRRRQVADLLRCGRTIAEIAGELGVQERTVRRDLKELRRAAARRDPWGDPPACAAAFIEDAELALQKVRAAQQPQAKEPNTLYLNLVKLEWAMLVKFIEMTEKLNGTQNEVSNHEDEDDPYANYSDEELIKEGRRLGVDVSPFERALRAVQAADRAGDHPPVGEPGDAGEGG